MMRSSQARSWVIEGAQSKKQGGSSTLLTRRPLIAIAIALMSLSGLLFGGAGPATASQGYAAVASGPATLYRPADSSSPCGDVFTINRISPSEVQIRISSWDIKAIIGTGYGTIDTFSNNVYRGGVSISSNAGKTFHLPAAPGQMIELRVKKDGYEFCAGDYYV